LAIDGSPEWWGGGKKVTQRLLLHADHMVLEYSNELVKVEVAVQYFWEEP
jgi:hypothetical protein